LLSIITFLNRIDKEVSTAIIHGQTDAVMGEMNQRVTIQQKISPTIG
jgi:hypothetical protein